MNYVELNISCPDELAEILIAELADYPFESFTTEPDLLKAYIPQERMGDCYDRVEALLVRYGVEEHRYIVIESQNWNALWESNFPPVEVDDVVARGTTPSWRTSTATSSWAICPTMWRR